MFDEVLKVFFEIWDVLGFKKKFFIFEFIDWLKFLVVEDILLEVFYLKDGKVVILLFYGVLLKNE